MKLEKFIEEIASLGLPVDPVINFIKVLYVAKKLPYEIEIKRTQYPYPTEVLFEVEDWIVDLVRKYYLILTGISETTVYGETANVRYYVLTEKGFDLGSQIFQKYLENIITKLVGILSKYPPTLLKIIALSAINLRNGKATWLSIKTEGLNLDTALSGATSALEISVMKPNQLFRIYEASKRVYGDLRLVLEGLKKARAKIYEPRIYDIFMSRVLINYNGKVLKKALSFMEDLSALELAIKIPVYSSKGEYLGEEYRAPPEIVYILDEWTSNIDLSQIRRPFLAVELIIRALIEKVAKQSLLEALNKLGIPEEEIKAALEIMYEQGITSRYNEAEGPDSPAFIILNKTKAREEIEKTIDFIENIILYARKE